MCGISCTDLPRTSSSQGVSPRDSTVHLLSSDHGGGHHIQRRVSMRGRPEGATLRLSPLRSHRSSRHHGGWFQCGSHRDLFQQEMLKERTGRSFPVRSVVLSPGWFVETVGAHAHDRVWVLNPKALPAFIAQEKLILSLEEIKTRTCHLSQYIRSI